MSTPSSTLPPRRTGAFQTLAIGASVMINIFLVVYLLKGNPQRTAKAPETASPANSEKAIAPNAKEVATPEVIPPEVAATDEPALDWRFIESSDLRQYVANLRAAGCPEQVVRDIITADVNRRYSERSQAIWQRPTTQYWQKYKQERPSSKQMEEFAALEKESQALFKDLLGTRVSKQELIDTLYLQVTGSERQLLFLPEDRREAALKALAETDADLKEQKSFADENRSRDQQKLFNEKLKSLADILSPEELEEFHQRNSPASGMLKSETRYLTLTPDEYKQLLLAKESGDARESTKETVRKLFGDDRAKEFESVSSAFYISARPIAEAEGIPLERVSQASKLANEFLTTGFTAINNRSLSVEERKARLVEVQSQAETQIKNLLGEKAAQPVLQSLSTSFRMSSRMIR